jgi:electron transport complex protein RnfD
MMEGFDAMTALSLILSGGLLIGAIFMATDYVTSPSTAWGKVIFGVGAGLLTFLIRYFGTYPEGISFAILFMNILTPYIEKLTAHKVFGGTKA